MRVEQAVADFLRAVRAEYGYSDHTVRAYQRDLKYLIEYAAESGCAEVAGLRLDDFRAVLWKRQQKEGRVKVLDSIAALPPHGQSKVRIRLENRKPLIRESAQAIVAAAYQSWRSSSLRCSGDPL